MSVLKHLKALRKMSTSMQKFRQGSNIFNHDWALLLKGSNFKDDFLLGVKGRYC